MFMLSSNSESNFNTKMSRAFVREDDQEEAPIIPPRAALPEGFPNYVTPLGKRLLEEERKEIESEIAGLSDADENQYRRKLTVLRGQLNSLLERISTAQIIDSAAQPRDEVRFGATVTYRMFPGRRDTTFRIVGVDEANIKEKKIAFVSPVAQAMIGHKAGDDVVFYPGDEKRILKIIKIEYV